MSEAQLEDLYAGLVRIAALSRNELQVLVQSLLDRTETHEVDSLQPSESRTTSSVTLPGNCHPTATPSRSLSP
jgi:hypothetical protein